MVEDGAGNEGAGGSDRNANDIAATTKEEARRQRAEAEFGDVLFSLINYARFLHINPENELEQTNRKFIKRFRYLEDKARDKGRLLKNMSLEEMSVFLMGRGSCGEKKCE